MPCAEAQMLTADEIQSVLRQPNGHYALLELIRMGRVDSTAAAEALDRLPDGDTFIKRVLMAMVDAFFSSTR